MERNTLRGCREGSWDQLLADHDPHEVVAKDRYWTTSEGAVGRILNAKLKSTSMTNPPKVVHIAATAIQRRRF
jgi:hypothetical protein